MFNKELLKKAEEKCGSLWTGGVSKDLIIKLSNDLEVNLPKSYIEFLETYGEGGVEGYIFGIEDEDYSSAHKKTILFRKEKSINKFWIVIGHIRTSWEEYLVCLDTSRMYNNECPVIKYDLIEDEIEDFKGNFYNYFNYKSHIAFNK